VITRQARELRRSVQHLTREGFRKVHVLRGTAAVDAATVVSQRLFTDRTDLTGPFDIVGDVHGCRAELEQLLQQLGWQLDHDDAGRPVGARHPQGRTAVFVAGNHEAKLVRKLPGAGARLPGS
jgi:hypothetical protein